MVLPLADRARHRDGLRVSDAGRDGLRLCDHRGRAEAAPGRRALGVGRLLADRDRCGDGDDPGRARPRLGALHVLSAADRQCLLLHRRRSRRGGFLDLGRADVDQPAGLAARPSRRAGAARDVCQCRRILSLGLDRGRGRARTAAAEHPGGARLQDHDRRLPGRARNRSAAVRRWRSAAPSATGRPASAAPTRPILRASMLRSSTSSFWISVPARAPTP